jgi:putative FmdB family regulatory protein
MPIYEYACKACGHSFELLVFKGLEPNCPACRAQEVEKVFSVFAVGRSAKPPTACAPKGVSSCNHCPGMAASGGCGMPPD